MTIMTMAATHSTINPSPAAAAAAAPAAPKQIPIVCPGHTRPLAELQFCETTSSAATDSSATTNSSSSLLLLLSACHDRVPMMRNGTTGDWMGSLVGHKGAVWCCRMDVATQTMIATASGDFSCRIYDAITGACLYTLSDAKHILKTCDFNPVSTTLLATAGHEGIVRVYDLVEQERRYLSTSSSSNNNNNINAEEEGSWSNRFPATNDGAATGKITIGKLNWYNDTIFCIGCSDGTVRFYNVPIPDPQPPVTTTNDSNLNTNKSVDPLPLQILSITDYLTSQHKNTLTNCEIRDMELKQITPPQNQNPHPNDQPYLALSIAAGNAIFIFDVTDLQSIQLLVQHTLTKINFYNEGGLSLHPTGTKFIVGGSDLYVYLYSISHPNATDRSAAVVTELECYKGHHGPIRCLRYSPSGTTFATGSEDGTIRLWQQP